MTDEVKVAPPQTSDPAWEVVHNITNFYDSPLEGVADFEGLPHLFFLHDEIVKPSVEDPEEFDIERTYSLHPVLPELLSALKENSDIFERWHQAYSQDQANMKHHPALPEDRPRHEELKASIGPHRAALRSAPAVLVRSARFAGNRRTVAPGASRWRSFEVQWSNN